MASQVLSGSSNPSYTNNTGQNVRVVINYMQARYNDIQRGLDPITLNWAGVSAKGNLVAIGRNLAFTSGGVFQQQTSFGQVDVTAAAIDANNAIGYGGALPTELMLAPGQTFSATCAVYNIVVIPEAG